MSPSRPKIGTVTDATSIGIVSTHAAVVVETPSSRSIVGSAGVTPVCSDAVATTKSASALSVRP
jgi:hypothetical protein